MEHPDYRTTIEEINKHFPDKLLLTIPEVMFLTGYKSPVSVRNNFPVIKGRVSKTTLARLLCGR